MSGFSNPVVGAGGALVRSSEHSPNYVAGTTGWTINQDGSAEFNSLTVRGTFKGTNFEINTSGIFLYSGTPAAGNLIGSDASIAGTDRFGNTYPAGVMTQVNVANTPTYRTSLFNNQLIFNYISATLFRQTGQLFASEPLNAAKGPQIVLESPSDNSTSSDISALILYGTSQDGTFPPQALLAGYVNGSNTQMAIDFVVNGNMFATDPATNNTKEPWHAITPQNGWANRGAGFPAFAARRNASPPGSVSLRGQLTGGTYANGTLLGTAGTGYLPALEQSVPLNVEGAAFNGGIGEAVIGTNGQIKLYSTQGSGTLLKFNGLYQLET